MILPGKRNSFYFEFPIDFIPDEVKKKYDSYINQLPETPINNAHDYLNHTIQKIDIPGFEQTPAVQNQRGIDTAFRSSLSKQNLFGKDLTISFQLTDGFINYFLLLETFFNYYKRSNPELHLGPFRIYTLDSNENVIASIILKQITFVGINNLSLDYTDNEQTFTGFEATFNFNLFGIELLNKGLTEDLNYYDEYKKRGQYSDAFDDAFDN